MGGNDGVRRPVSGECEAADAGSEMKFLVVSFQFLVGEEESFSLLAPRNDATRSWPIGVSYREAAQSLACLYLRRGVQVRLKIRRRCAPPPSILDEYQTKGLTKSAFRKPLSLKDIDDGR